VADAVIEAPIFFTKIIIEEVKKGMLEKVEQGQYASRAPLGYTNNDSAGERTKLAFARRGEPRYIKKFRPCWVVRQQSQQSSYS
jgi:hypothetical protein